MKVSLSKEVKKYGKTHGQRVFFMAIFMVSFLWGENKPLSSASPSLPVCQCPLRKRGLLLYNKSIYNDVIILEVPVVVKGCNHKKI